MYKRQVTDGATEVLLDEGRTSWMLCAEEGRIYYSDIAANAVLCYDLETGREEIVLEAPDILYGVQTAGGRLYTTDYMGYYMLEDGEASYVDALTYSQPLLRCALWAALFLGGLLAVAAAWLVSRLSKADQAVALILAGMMISSLFSAGTSFVKLVADTQQQLPAITYWLMGSLSSIKDKDVVFLAIPVALGMIPLFFLRWRMNLLTVGEEEAQSMGVNTRRLRGAVIVCATLLTSASVAVSGMIGWVGLVIPHFCRMLFGYDYRRLIPAGALFGAAFLLAVDDIARLVTTGCLLYTSPSPRD